MRPVNSVELIHSGPLRAKPLVSPPVYGDGIDFAAYNGSSPSHIGCPGAIVESACRGIDAVEKVAPFNVSVGASSEPFHIRAFDGDGSDVITRLSPQ